MISSRFMTRYDEPGAQVSRFYFAAAAAATALAKRYSVAVFQSSPVAAGGGLYRVVIPYVGGEPVIVIQQEHERPAGTDTTENA